MAVLRKMTLDDKKHHLGDMPCLAKDNEGPMPVGKSYLQCVSRRAFVRLQYLSNDYAYSAYREKHLSSYSACRKQHAYNAYPESVSLTMLVERSMLIVRIDRRICPLTMLLERSMLTMRTERSI